MTENLNENLNIQEPEEELYGPSESLIQDIGDALADGEKEQVLALVEPLHAADLADVLETLSPMKRYQLIDMTSVSLRAETFLKLDSTVREGIADHLGTVGLLQLLGKFDTDDAIEFVEDLSYSQQNALLQFFSKEQRQIIEESLSFPEESAGRLMSREVVVVPAFWTVDRTTKYLQESGNVPESFDDIVVIDPRHKPVGILHLSSLIRHSGDRRIRELIRTDIKTVPYHMDQEEVANLFNHYVLSFAPVVDDDGHILGMITADDVIQVIAEEATEDLLLLGGVKESDFYAPWFVTWYQRVGWLVVTLINTMLSVAVLSYFEQSIEKMALLAVLMPLVATMGGSSGMQVMTVTVRALAMKELRSSNTMRAIGKEILVGIVHGIFFAVLLWAISYWWYQSSNLGLILGASLIFNMIWAALVGVGFPIIIDKLGLDPAVSVGPVLTTTTDILGYASFLGLATIFLL